MAVGNGVALGSGVKVVVGANVAVGARVWVGAGVGRRVAVGTGVLAGAIVGVGVDPAQPTSGSMIKLIITAYRIRRADRLRISRRDMDDLSNGMAKL